MKSVKWNLFFTFAITISTVSSTFVSCWAISESRITRKVENAAILTVDESNLAKTIAELQNGESLSWTIKVVNSGKTPAKNINAYFTFSMDVTPLTENPIINQTKDYQHSLQSSIVSGGKELHLRQKINLNSEQINAYIKNNSRLYVWGYVTYQDIFNENHKLNFCLNNTDPTFTTLGFCKTHNSLEY
jgi:hypothetical protein